MDTIVRHVWTAVPYVWQARQILVKQDYAKNTHTTVRTWDNEAGEKMKHFFTLQYCDMKNTCARHR